MIKLPSTDEALNYATALEVVRGIMHTLVQEGGEHYIIIYTDEQLPEDLEAATKALYEEHEREARRRAREALKQLLAEDESE